MPLPSTTNVVRRATACVADIGDVPAVGRAELKRLALSGVERLLLKTRNFGDGAEYLASLPLKLVGIDYFSIDQYQSGRFPAHHSLLGKGIVIAEVICLPMRLVGLDGGPVRAILREL